MHAILLQFKLKCLNVTSWVYEILCKALDRIMLKFNV